MNPEQVTDHVKEMREKDPERFKRAILLAAFQRAMYEAFVAHSMSDDEIIGLLANSLVEMAEARGMTAPDLDKEITRCREIRALVNAKVEGSIQ